VLNPIVNHPINYLYLGVVKNHPIAEGYTQFHEPPIRGLVTINYASSNYPTHPLPIQKINPYGPYSCYFRMARAMKDSIRLLYWLVVDLPLWKMMELTSLGMMKVPIYIYIWKVIKFHGSSHHQPVIHTWLLAYWDGFCRWFPPLISSIHTTHWFGRRSVRATCFQFPWSLGFLENRAFIDDFHIKTHLNHLIRKWVVNQWYKWYIYIYIYMTLGKLCFGKLW